MSEAGLSIGCLGKCTSGMSSAELDFVTDHICRTLGHEQGRWIFRRFLEQAQRNTDLRCLNLYEQCLGYVNSYRIYSDSAADPSVEPLVKFVTMALSTADSLEDVPEIDAALLERYMDALRSKSRDDLNLVLEDTMTILTHRLKTAHEGFREFAVKPCPRRL